MRRRSPRAEGGGGLYEGLIINALNAVKIELARTNSGPPLFLNKSFTVLGTATVDWKALLINHDVDFRLIGGLTEEGAMEVV